MSRFQTTLGGICRVKNGGLALHFGVESASRKRVVIQASDPVKQSKLRNLGKKYFCHKKTTGDLIRHGS